MIGKLLQKEHLLNKSQVYSGKFQAFMMTIFKVVFLAVFIAIECFIVISLDNKVEEYSSLGFYDFLVFILFVFFLISFVVSLFNLRKAFFNKLDQNILSPLPVENWEIVLSKLLYVYIKQFFLNLLICAPVIISYGALRDASMAYYINAVLYPIMISLAAVGFGILFVIPFEYLYRFVKKHDLLQFILATILVVIMCFIYRYILNIFLTALNNSSFGGMFNELFIQTVNNISSYLYPVANILQAIINKDAVTTNFGIYILSMLVLFVLGLWISLSLYTRMNRIDASNNTKKEKAKTKKLDSLNMALIKKELGLLFKDSAYLFSYTSLLILMPFLSYVVISSLSGLIYQNFLLFSTVFPELTSGISMIMVLLFISVINANATLSISREDKSLLVIKSVPVKASRQISIKLIIPILLSSVSLIVSLAVLYGFGELTWYVALTTLILGLLYIVFSNILGLLVDMHDRSSKAKHKVGYLNNLMSILYPVIVLAAHMVMVWFKFETSHIYLIEIAGTFILFLPLFIRLRKKITKAFKAMEISI